MEELNTDRLVSCPVCSGPLTVCGVRVPSLTKLQASSKVVEADYIFRCNTCGHRMFYPVAAPDQLAKQDRRDFWKLVQSVGG